jgi:hypothetical protein
MNGKTSLSTEPKLKPGPFIHQPKRQQEGSLEE